MGEARGALVSARYRPCGLVRGRFPEPRTPAAAVQRDLASLGLCTSVLGKVLSCFGVTNTAHKYNVTKDAWPGGCDGGALAAPAADADAAAPAALPLPVPEGAAALAGLAVPVAQVAASLALPVAASPGPAAAGGGGGK